MLKYCPLKDCECKYRYCPCFTGDEDTDRFGCKLVTAVELYIKDMNSRMTISELAQSMIGVVPTDTARRIMLEDDCK